MRTNILNPDAFTELLDSSDARSELPLLHCDLTPALLPDILYFCHYCVWLRLKQTRNKLWPKKTSLQTLSLQSIITSKLLWTFIYSSLKHSPPNVAKILCAGTMHLFNSSQLITSPTSNPTAYHLFSEKEQQWHQNWYTPRKKHLPNNFLSEKRPIWF